MRRVLITAMAVFVLAGLPHARAQQPGPVKVTGKVVDEQGKPVSGAAIASSWIRSFRGKAADTLRPMEDWATGPDGTFAVELQLYGRDTALLAMDRERKRGGLAVVRAKQPGEPVTITLGPLSRVHGTFSCSDLGAAPKWTNVYLSDKRSGSRVVMNESEQASFDVLLPVGTYQLWAYGTDVADLRKEIEVKPGMADLDLKTLDLPATIIARHKGKAPPAWNVTDARGVGKDVKLADFKGKWVLMEFWGFW